MTPQILTFANYSPSRFAKLETLLIAKGFKAEGDVGEVKEGGADVSYAYDGVSNLTLLVRSAPHWPLPDHDMAKFVMDLAKQVDGVPAS